MGVRRAAGMSDHGGVTERSRRERWSNGFADTAPTPFVPG